MSKKSKSPKTKKISNKLKSTITNVVKVSVNNRRKGKTTRTPKAEPQIRYIPQPIFQNSSGDIQNINRRLDDIQQGLRYKPPTTTITTQTPIQQPQFQGERRSAPDLFVRSPTTSVVKGLEQMREYLKENIFAIPTKKTYSPDEIDSLQANRLQTLYEDTKANLFAPSSPDRGGTVFDDDESLFGGASVRTKKS